MNKVFFLKGTTIFEICLYIRFPLSTHVNMFSRNGGRRGNFHRCVERTLKMFGLPLVAMCENAQYFIQWFQKPSHQFSKLFQPFVKWKKGVMKFCSCKSFFIYFFFYFKYWQKFTNQRPHVWDIQKTSSITIILVFSGHPCDCVSPIFRLILFLFTGQGDLWPPHCQPGSWLNMSINHVPREQERAWK